MLGLSLFSVSVTRRIHRPLPPASVRVRVSVSVSVRVSVRFTE